MGMRIVSGAVFFLALTASTLHAMGSSEADIKGISKFHPVIAHAQGDVKIRKEGEESWIDAGAGMLLLSGDEIVTGVDSQAVIRFASGSVRIYENSVMVVPFLGPDRQRKDIRNIFIDEGAGRFMINPRGTREGFEFRTKTVQGSVRGTDFTVKVKETFTIVVVSKGIVELSDGEGGSERTFALKRGEAARLDEGKVFDDISVLSVKNTRDPEIRKTLDTINMEENLVPEKVNDTRNDDSDRDPSINRKDDGTSVNTVP